MENNNENNGRRRVFRQSWRPTGLWAVLRGGWIAAYSVLKIALAALATVILIAGVCGAVFVGVLADYLEEDIAPQANVQLEGFDIDQPSYIYYVDNSGNIQVLQKLYADTDSEWASFEEIPEEMIYAAVAIEDHRFFEHQGVDWFTTIKACINMFVGSGDSFGGSSITQQLIKNMMLTEDEAADDVTVQRKVMEIFRATEFEKEYDKSVVLEWYLNYIYLGNRCTGVKAAAEKYFGKELEDLTAAECACIISITNNPSIYNPLGTKEITYDGETHTCAEWNKIRRENVLYMMKEYGYLTKDEYAVALEQSENLQFKEGVPFEDRYSDCAECGYHAHNDTYVVEDGVYHCPECNAVTTIGEDVSQDVYSWFVDTVLEDVAAEMAVEAGYQATDKEMIKLYKKLICSGGYHIYSTFDLDAQNAVDKIYTDLDEIPTTSSLQQLESGIVIIDNKTGDIIAMSGGVGEKKVFDAYNRATDAMLQPGSSLKPLSIYAPAFELELVSPVSVMKDMPIYYYDTANGKIVTSAAEAEGKLSSFPKNDNKKYSYSYSIYQGIVSSVNGVAVNTLDTMGLETSFKFAKEKFRLNTLVETYTTSSGSILTDIAYSPLGMGAPSVGVTVRDMAEAFATFSNGGVWREGRTFTHVYNTDGELVLYNEQESEAILSEKTVEYMNYCLTGAVNSGTGTAAKISGQKVAGKTGTTSSAKDRWFCGFTEYYTAGVWCGYDQPEVIKLTGEKTNPACRLFAKVMKPLHKGLDSVDLYDEEKFVEVEICRDSGLLATDACADDCRGSRVVKASAYEDDVPTQLCDKHIEVAYCSVCKAPANDYCHNYAELGLTELSTVSLMKLTKDEVEKIVMATSHGLNKSFLSNDYIYLVDEYGLPTAFYGINGNKNEGLNYPYVVGTKHSKSTWQQYVASHPNAGSVVSDDNVGENTEE